MPIYKDFSITLDTKRTVKIAIPNIVAGETGVRFLIRVTDNGEDVNLDNEYNRVCLRVDSALGTRRQDSAVTGSNITFLTDGTVRITLSKDSFTSGLNRARIEIYSSANGSNVAWNDVLICTAKFQFTADGNPTGENVGAAFPSLVQMENDLIAAKNAANTAAANANTKAGLANTAAEAANTAAANADTKAELADTAATYAHNKGDIANTAAQLANTAATNANTKAGLANTAAEAANTAASNANTKAGLADTAASSATSAASTLNAMIANIDGTPTSGSDHLVKSGGVYSAIASFDISSYVSGKTWGGTAESPTYIKTISSSVGSNIVAAAQNKRLVFSLPNPDGDTIFFDEYYRDQDQRLFFFKSLRSLYGYVYEATLDIDGNSFVVSKYKEAIPVSASVSNGTVSFKDAFNNTLFSFTLPLYN